jgi:hypothetical protein
MIHAILVELDQICIISHMERERDSWSALVRYIIL